MKADSGKRNEHDEKFIARHEICGDINDFCAAAYRILKHGGKFYTVWRPDRLCDLIFALRQNRLEPKIITFVHATKDSEPSMVLIQSTKGGASGSRTTRPLILHESDEDARRSVLSPDAQIIYESCSFEQFFNKNLYQYNGYKEDFYLADYQPDSAFLDKLPFEHYVVVRPENIKASYVEGRQSIVPELLKALDAKGYNILFLPRYESDRDYAQGIKNIYIPATAVNGMDACYYADAILTGAGTMAREAACLGVPSVSFFAGAHLLSVDQSLVDAGKMFFSRDVEHIMQYLESAKGSFFTHRAGGVAGLARCKQVQQEILDTLDKKIREYLDR
jgi:hypothetical protein